MRTPLRFKYQPLLLRRGAKCTKAVASFSVSGVFVAPADSRNPELCCFHCDWRGDVTHVEIDGG